MAPTKDAPVVRLDPDGVRRLDVGRGQPFRADRHTLDTHALLIGGQNGAGHGRSVVSDGRRNGGDGGWTDLRPTGHHDG
jgi:hypothetical protein